MNDTKAMKIKNYLTMIVVKIGGNIDLTLHVVILYMALFMPPIGRHKIQQ